jgi:hypothetical protein
MTRRTPTRSDHETFCRTEGWTRVRDARGRAGTHHVTYELALPDGQVLRTRISHPVNRTDYGPALWAHILRDQLQVTAEEFWACVDDASVPARGAPITAKESLPADLAYLLIHRVGLDERTVASMSKQQAIDRINRYWTHGA